MNSPQAFAAAIATLRIEDCFNPYKQRCPEFDLPTAPKQRLAILEAILSSAATLGVSDIWVGRDLGHKGGRRTGLALTDDVHAATHVARWGAEFTQATRGPPVAERTAALVWSILNQVDSRVFLWNVFPLHPHHHGDPFTNRGHNASERRIGEEILASMIDLLKPSRAVAIGLDASKSLTRLMRAQNVISVRHPSYGGQTDFLRQMRAIYSLTPRPANRICFDALR